VVAAAAAGAFLFFGSSGTNGPTPGPVSQSRPTTLPPRTPFAFQIGRVRAYTLRRQSANKLAAQAAGAIAERLSGFYDTAFADPASWKAGVPDDAWTVFAGAIRDQARGEAGSFTPAVNGLELVTLDVTKSSLTVTVMFDGAGRPQAAFAKVVFEGTGELEGGQAVEVDNAATYFLRSVSGTWVIAGYPEAKTKIEAGAAAPGASASPSAGSSP
jgi:hypothetical protein